MNTKLTRRQQQWLDTIIECRTSGLTDRQWCDEHGIASSTFYYNVRKLQDRACDIPETAALTDSAPQVQEVVPLNIMDSEQPSESELHKETRPDPFPSIRMDFEGFHFEIRNNASADVIFNTLQALQKLC